MKKIKRRMRKLTEKEKTQLKRLKTILLASGFEEIEPFGKTYSSIVLVKRYAQNYDKGQRREIFDYLVEIYYQDDEVIQNGPLCIVRAGESWDANDDLEDWIIEDLEKEFT